MRHKLPEEKKKKKTGFTIDTELLEIFEEYLKEVKISNRSKYVENLIRIDLQKRGKTVEKIF